MQLPKKPLVGLGLVYVKIVANIQFLAPVDYFLHDWGDLIGNGKSVFRVEVKLDFVFYRVVDRLQNFLRQRELDALVDVDPLQPEQALIHYKLSQVR